MADFGYLYFEMAARKTHIPGGYIASPCPKTLGELNKVEDGYFCGECKHLVFDFRSISPEKFFEIYREKKGQLCGIYYEDRDPALIRILNLAAKAAAATLLLLSGSAWNKVFAILPSWSQEQDSSRDTSFRPYQLELINNAVYKRYLGVMQVRIESEGYSLYLPYQTVGSTTIELPSYLYGKELRISVEGKRIRSYKQPHLLREENLKVYLEQKKVKRRKRIFRRHVVGKMQPW